MACTLDACYMLVACILLDASGTDTACKYQGDMPKMLVTCLEHARTIIESHLPYKTGLDVTQSHPLRRMRFGQYQASSAALGWLGDGDCHIMHSIFSEYVLQVCTNANKTVRHMSFIWMLYSMGTSEPTTALSLLLYTLNFTGYPLSYFKGFYTIWLCSLPS